MKIILFTLLICISYTYDIAAQRGRSNDVMSHILEMHDKNRDGVISMKEKKTFTSISLIGSRLSGNLNLNDYDNVKKIYLTNSRRLESLELENFPSLETILITHCGIKKLNIENACNLDKVIVIDTPINDFNFEDLPKLRKVEIGLADCNGVNFEDCENLETISLGEWFNESYVKIPIWKD